MPTSTIQHYDDHAEQFFSRYETANVAGLHSLLRHWLPAEGRILEIGCGSGRDARFMASNPGLDVTATDASKNLIELAAKQAAPRDGKSPLFRQAVFPLNAGHDLLSERFDAIVAIALLMHLADNELFEFAYQVRTMLKSGGIFFCSFCPGRESTTSDPRSFIDRQAGQIQLLFERLGFNLLHQEENQDSLGRDLNWTTLVFRLESRFAARPVDQIESIINHDKKTATYKLALLRACCEIAQTSLHHATWHPGDRVSIPLGLIVEKWLYYYWPLIDSDLNLPEMRVGRNAKSLAFRPAFNRFIDSFKPGGLNAFFALFQSGRLTGEQAGLLGHLTTLIAQTIIKGPITYSGGSLEGVDRVFSFSGVQKLNSCNTPTELAFGFGRVYLPASIWREMCLVGHWIGEAILLRWAELSRSFAGQPVEISDVLAQLLTIPVAERATGEAKKIFSRHTDLICVWSDRKLSPGKFDLDHVIPFSIWHNNDLWNLLPTDPGINLQKHDKMVTRDLLFSRRDHLIHYWRILQQADPLRFFNQVGRTLLGKAIPVHSENWENPVFFSLAEAVETFACQRGVQRWPEHVI